MTSNHGDFVSPERKKSEVNGTGIQYLPGHEELFVDYVIEKCLPQDGAIVDLGGGGLRFAIPAAHSGRTVKVVDLDPLSLDVQAIAAKVNANGKFQTDINLLTKNIITIESDLFAYLRTCQEEFKFVSAFRVIHFFTPDQITEFFSLINRRLTPQGTLVVSSMTPFDLTTKNDSFNELYLNSDEVTPGYRYHRKFRDNELTRKIRQEQNLAEVFHLTDNELIKRFAEKTGFTVTEPGRYSTRIVQGYILKKT